MQIMITDVQIGRGRVGGCVWMPIPGFYDISKVSKLSHFVLFCFILLFCYHTVRQHICPGITDASRLKYKQGERTIFLRGGGGCTQANLALY